MEPLELGTWGYLVREALPAHMVSSVSHVPLCREEGEMAQLAKGLPHGGLELFLGTHMKSQVWLILVISALGEQGPLGFNDQIV